MLRVLTLSTLFPNAARPNHGVFVAEQTRRLAARDDVDLRVVAPIGLPPVGAANSRYAELVDLAEVETWDGLKVERPRYPVLPAISGPLNPRLVARAAARAMRHLRDEGFAFDVIDAEFFYPDGPAAMRLARKFGVPFSVKARGSDIHYWAMRRSPRRQMLAAGRAAAGLLAVSAALRQDMGKAGFDAAKVAVHHTGVDLARFAPRTVWTSQADVPTVVSLGALIPIKGHDLVIRALANIPEARLVVAGRGPEQVALEALARQVGLGERIRFMGDVAHEAIPNILAGADVMALASQREGLANAWIESLACGTPIVIPDVGGARDVVDRPAAGRIVGRSVEGIAAGIREVLQNPPPRAEVRAAAERFSWESNTQALFEHLSACAGRT